MSRAAPITSGQVPTLKPGTIHEATNRPATAPSRASNARPTSVIRHVNLCIGHLLGRWTTPVNGHGGPEPSPDSGEHHRSGTPAQLGGHGTHQGDDAPG